MPGPWRKPKEGSPPVRRFLAERSPAAAHGFSRIATHETRLFCNPPSSRGPTACQGFGVTNHETRNTAFLIGSPCGDKAELKMAEPKTEIRRPHPSARRQATTSLRRLTRPFRDIPGLWWPDNGFLPTDNGSISRLSPQFFGITRYNPDPPRAAVRVPSAVLARLPGAPSAAAPAALRAASAASRLRMNPC